MELDPVSNDSTRLYLDLFYTIENKKGVKKFDERFDNELGFMIEGLGNMLKYYLKHIKALPELPQVYMVEKLAKLRLGNVVVWLKADRVDKLGDNKYAIIDYKSGKPATKKAERASVQIPSYGLWVRQSINSDAALQGAYYYLKFMDTKKGIHEYEITDEWMEEAVEKYTAVDHELKNGCKFVQNFKYKYCGNCDFGRFCLEDESDDL